MGTGRSSVVISTSHKNAGGPGSRWKTSSSETTSIRLPRISKGTGTALCVGHGNGGLQSSPETKRGCAISAMSRITKPPSQFLGTRRFPDVEDHHDVSEVAVDCRRAVDIVAVEIEAVHTLPSSLPTRDLTRTIRRADVVDTEAASVFAGEALVGDLVIDDHQALCDADFV